MSTKDCGRTTVAAMKEGMGVPGPLRQVRAGGRRALRAMLAVNAWDLLLL